jgi:hypothetical protein
MVMSGGLVSALLMGGNVTVPTPRTVGGDFAHIPACTSIRQTGCGVVYSSFTSKPPRPNSQFARTSSNDGVGLLARIPSSNLRIMCVNPASPAGGRAPLDPYLPSRPDLPASRELASRDDSVGRVPRRVHRGPRDVRGRDLATGQPRGRI